MCDDYEGIEDAAYFYENQCESDIEKMKQLIEGYINTRKKREKKLMETENKMELYDNVASYCLSWNGASISDEFSRFIELIIFARAAIRMAKKDFLEITKNEDFYQNPSSQRFARGCEEVQYILNDNFSNEFLRDLQDILDKAINDYNGENLAVGFIERINKRKEEKND